MVKKISNHTIRKNSGGERKAPSEHAKDYYVGHQKIGNDGNMWEIVETKRHHRFTKGVGPWVPIKRWKRVKGSSPKKSQKKTKQKWWWWRGGRRPTRKKSQKRNKGRVIRNITKRDVGRVTYVAVPPNKQMQWRWITRESSTKKGRFYARAPKIGIRIGHLSRKKNTDYGKERMLPKNSRIHNPPRYISRRRK